MKRIITAIVVMFSLVFVFADAASAHPYTSVSITDRCDKANGHVFGEVYIESAEVQAQGWRVTVPGHRVNSARFAPGGGHAFLNFDLGLAPTKATTVKIDLWYIDANGNIVGNIDTSKSGSFAAVAPCFVPPTTTSTTSTTSTTTTSTTVPATTSTTSTTPTTSTVAPTTTIPVNIGTPKVIVKAEPATPVRTTKVTFTG